MTKKEQRSRRKPEEIVDGEILGEFDSGTLLNLPPVPDDKTHHVPSTASQKSSTSRSAAKVRMPAPDMSPAGGSSAQETGVDGEDVARRQLITRLIIGGAAALALGGSAALLLNRQADPEVIVLPNGSDVTDPEQLAALASRAIELENQLIQVTAERDQAISERDAALRDLAALQERCGELETINALWEQHDAVGLDSQIRAALLSVGSMLRNMLAGAGLLQAGLASGQAAVTAFTSQFALPQGAIQWLQGQSAGLARLLETLSMTVEQVVEPAASLVQKVAEFVLWVLSRLPFGAGTQARAGMEAMQAVINTLPELVEGIDTTVMTPLGTWFGADPRKNLSGSLIAPIKGDILTPAADLVDRVTAFDTTYQEGFTQVEAALAQRDALLLEIQRLQVRAANRRHA
ncbi:MAG: hypothetical protein IT326_05090 [Anaerolineae bacterium]|nr:hypothetical protein [Anaerolineae bacterium]